METKLNAGNSPETHSLARTIDETGWACFLIMTGALWLAPSGWLPEGTWVAGTGLIMLAINAVRYHHRLRTSVFGIIVGLAVMFAGVGKIVDHEILSVPIVVIVLGVAMVVKVIAGAGRRNSALGAQ